MMIRILMLAVLSIFTPAGTPSFDCDDITPACASHPIVACGPVEARIIASPLGAELCKTERSGRYCYAAYRATTEACGCSWENGVSPQ